MSSDKEAKSYLDLLIATLQQHEKTLSQLADRLETIVNKILLTDKLEKTVEKIETLAPVEAVESEFIETVGENLMKLPKGYSFEIPKVTHVAEVVITMTEPKEGLGAVKAWEEAMKRRMAKLDNQPTP